MKNIFILAFTFLFAYSFAQDESIYFETDQYNIQQTEKGKLTDIKNEYQNGSFLIRLVGHCDEAGSVEYNQVLSKNRVESVKGFLINLGIPNYDIETDYLGEQLADKVAQEYRKVDVFLVRKVEELSLEIEEEEGSIQHHATSGTADIEDVISSRDFDRMKEGWKVTYDVFMDSIKPELQVFIFDHEEEMIIEGDKGTIIRIPENAFVYENGEAARGRINLQLVEYYSKKDFISDRLATISQGNLIKSAGMIKLEAKSMNEKLELAEGKKLDILFPKMDMAYSTFYGERLDDGSMNWKIDEAYTKVKKLNLDDFGVTTSKDGEGLELVDREEAKKRNKKAKFKGMDGIFIEVTPEYLDSLEELQNQKLARWEAGEKVRTKITAKNLGFINCDRFMDEKTSDAEILVQIKNDGIDALNAFLVFKDLNSIIEIRQEEDNIFFYNALLPLGKEVELIVVGKDENDGIYFHQSTMDIDEKMDKNIQLKECSYKELDQFLSRL